MKMILKYADVLEVKPFHMAVASRELRAFATESLNLEDPLDVSYCQFSSASCYASPVPSLGPPSSSNASAMAFEPEVVEVTVGKPPAGSGRLKQGVLKPKISEEKKFVYNTASLLVKQDSESWPKALETARKLWQQHMPKKNSGMPAQRILYEVEAEEAEHSDDACLDVVADIAPR